MTDRNIAFALLMLVCGALSFIFSGMETGVLALNRFRIRQRMKAGDRSATVLHGFLKNPENFLWTILVGNTVVNLLLFSVGSIQLFFQFGDKPLVWAAAFILGVFVFYVVCELLPKTLFQRYPNRLSTQLARPFSMVHGILSPLVAVAGWVSRWIGGQAFTGRLFGSREELRFMMQESAPSLTSEERAMINRVLDLPNLRVRHVMIPNINVTSVPAAMPLKDVFDICRARNLTRVPVMDAGGWRVVGIINLEQLLYRNGLDLSKPADAFVQSPLYVSVDLHLEQALRRMQQSGAQFAIVVTADQREAGILTLQDVLKVIFGEVML